MSELVGDPETLIVDSTLLSVLHPRQVKQSGGFEGAAWVRWDSFSVYGVKLHLLCATNRVPLSYELTAANVAEIRLTKELLAEANLGEDHLARRLFGDLAYRSEALEEALSAAGILLVSERSRQSNTCRATSGLLWQVAHEARLPRCASCRVFLRVPSTWLPVFWH